MLHEKKGFRDGLTGYHYLVLVVACLGWSFDTMDQWLFVFAKQHAIRELLAPAGTDPQLIDKNMVVYYSNIATAALMIGWATGGLLFGMVGDRLGRTKTMGLTILLYAMFTGLSGLAQDVYQFSALRFLTGLGVGGEFAAGAALVAEAFPAHARATALGIVQATSALGNVLAALINLGFASMGWNWRWLFGVGVLPALLLVVIFAFIHEPEAWVQARAEHKKRGGGNYGSIFGLFREPILRRNTIIGMLLAAVGVIGFWGVGVLTPELLRSVLNPDNLPGLKSAVEQKVSYAGMAQNFGSFFGALGFAYVAQRFGRKMGFLVAFLGCIVMVPVTFFCTNSFVSAIFLFFLLGFMLLFVMGGFAVYFPELFPTRLRSTGTGFCYNVARFITAGTLFASAPLTASLGIAGMVYAVMIVYVMGLVVLIFAPETKGQPLPE
jgi:MFS family permease